LFLTQSIENYGNSLVLFYYEIIVVGDFGFRPRIIPARVATKPRTNRPKTKYMDRPTQSGTESKDEAETRKPPTNPSSDKRRDTIPTANSELERRLWYIS